MADRVGEVTSWTFGATAEGDKYALGVKTGSYISHCNYKVEIYAYRPNGYTDSTLRYSILCTEMTAYAASTWGTSVLGDIDCNYGHEGKILTPDGKTTLGNVATGSTNWIDGPFLARNVLDAQQFGYETTNTDPPASLGDSGPVPEYLISKDETLWTRTHTYINGIENYTNSAEERNKTRKVQYMYPPYIDKYKIDSLVSDDKKLADSNGNIVLKSNYKIVKAGYNVKYEWNPNGTSGPLGASIINDLIVNGGTYSNVGSPYTVAAPNSSSKSYTAQVKRYYGECSVADLSGVEVYSNKLTRYTYARPTLTSISTNTSTVSPRAGGNLTVSLNGMNNRTWSIENQFRTGIWSNLKSKYYLDYESTSNSRTLTADELKTLFPDSSANNGEVNGTLYVNRRNLGVSGGNPGSGSLVYETDVRTASIKVQYKPTSTIDPNKEPSNDESSSGLAFYKNENSNQGVKLPAGQTWVLPNTYDIKNMTGVNVKIQYPKTNSSGVLSGYRIKLYLPNDGSPNSGKLWYETYRFTTDYTSTHLISYNDLKRGISGNTIEITPFYVPEGVAKNADNKGSFWYGPTITSKFVDIAWMLDNPVIDCPVNDTTWHNHQYRILFKLPHDKDTNKGGTNDIEAHYGSGSYRYQNIEVKINGVVTSIGNNAYINAVNGWDTPVKYTGSKLTFKRAIVINPALIPTYKQEGAYTISVRVRKAYGQNSNWDGWSNWSSDITVKRKTVENAKVTRHEYITAAHYMNVQNSYNTSTACYAKTMSDNKAFVTKESFNRVIGDNINGPHLSPPANTPLQTIKEYVSEFNDLHQLKTKINTYGTFDTGRDAVKLDSANKLLATFTPSQEFITAAKDQDGATSCNSIDTILKGRNYMKYMCDELNNLK